MTTPKTESSSKPISRLEIKLQALFQHKIDLGLERLLVVLKRLDLSKPTATIITIGGTNGKGSTVAATCALLNSQGKTFGAFTSPHIFKFNERININGQLATDDDILNAFTVIDTARHETHLSYFEYAFLAAMIIFVESEVDVIVLEVGMGGRLDATNAIDADVAIITTVDIDHTQWLGNDIETIAKEKAGIMRANKSMIYGDLNTPEAIKSHALALPAQLLEFDKAHQIEFNETHFSFYYQKIAFNALTRPKLKGDWQLKNFANALTALIELDYQFSQEQVQQSIDNWQIKGRMQTMQTEPLVIADVAHNQQSASQLAQWLKDHPCEGYTKAVFSVLADKQLDQWLGQLDEVIDHWFIFQLPGERAMDLLALKITMCDHVSLISQFDSAKQAYQVAVNTAKPEDRIIVFGSFHVLDEVFK